MIFRISLVNSNRTSVPVIIMTPVAFTEYLMTYALKYRWILIIVMIIIIIIIIRHLADTFILAVLLFPGTQTFDLCVANAVLYCLNYWKELLLKLQSSLLLLLWLLLQKQCKIVLTRRKVEEN